MNYLLFLRNINHLLFLASKCGLTPQYEKLQSLFEKYGNEKFIIIGFPSNNFLFQEPGSNEEISSFCKSNYGVSVSNDTFFTSCSTTSCYKK